MPRGLGWEEEPEREEKEESLIPARDKLNLSGLLNVIDGVVDSPGRVLVMTSNHPEKLDPALIRPGRINKRLHLGYVTAETLLEIAHHYCDAPKPAPPALRRKAEEITASGRGITPAWAEQCSAEADSIDELFEKLRELKTSSA